MYLDNQLLIIGFLTYSNQAQSLNRLGSSLKKDLLQDDSDQSDTPQDKPIN